MALIFCGYFVGEDGKLSRQQAARTLDEAEERADKLRTELRRRGVHPEVLKFCRAQQLFSCGIGGHKDRGCQDQGNVRSFGGRRKAG